MNLLSDMDEFDVSVGYQVERWLEPGDGFGSVTPKGAIGAPRLMDIAKKEM